MATRQPPKVMSPGASVQPPKGILPTKKSPGLYPAKKPVGPSVSPLAAQLAQARAYYAQHGHIPTMLANLSNQYFGTANSKDVSDLGMQVAEGKMTLAQAQSIARQGTANLDPTAKRAGLAADTQITPQETALQTQANLGQQAFDRAQQIGAAQNARTVDEQHQIYGRLNSQLQSQVPQISGIYDTGRSGVDDAYNKLQQSLGSNYDSAIAGTNGELSRLGIQQAAPAATANLSSDEQFLKGVAGIQQQGEQGTLTNMKNMNLNDALSAIAQSATEGSALSANTLRDYAKSSSDARFQQAQQTADLQSQAAALEGTRKGTVYENTANLNQVAAQQAYQQQQDAIANALAQQKADAQSAIAGSHVTSANSDSAYKMGMLGVNQMDAMTRAQAAAATAGLDSAKQQQILNTMTPGTAAYQQIESQINKNNASAAGTLSNAATNSYKATHPAGQTQRGLALSGTILSSAGPLATAGGQVVNHAYNKYPPSSVKATNDVNFASALHEARSIAEKQVAGMANRNQAQAYLNTIDRAVAAAYGH